MEDEKDFRNRVVTVFPSDNDGNDRQQRYKNARDKFYLDYFDKYYIDIEDKGRIDRMEKFGQWLTENPQMLDDWLLYFYRIYMYGINPDNPECDRLFEMDIKEAAQNSSTKMWMLESNVRTENTRLFRAIVRYFKDIDYLSEVDVDENLEFLEAMKNKSPFVFQDFNLYEFFTRGFYNVLNYVFIGYQTGVYDFKESKLFEFFKKELAETGLKVEWTENLSGQENARGFYIEF